MLTPEIPNNSTVTSQRRVLKVVLVVVLILAAVIIALVLRTEHKRLSLNSTPTTALAPTSSPSATSQASPTATISPTASTSPGELPSSAVTFLANFYSAYKAKDTDRLAKSFAPDTNDQDASLHSRLFTGSDPQGHEGGPTLFVTNSASQVATSYQILNSTTLNSGWSITVQEQRDDGRGGSLGAVTTLITLVPATAGGGTWLIDQYQYPGSSGKYGAFLLQ